MTAPPQLVQQWETAYQHYTNATEHATHTPNDPHTAHLMASASWQVASLWRDIATATVLPWWALAALRAAAEAFEAQAQAWHAKTRLADRAMSSEWRS
jgi:hypothetical protein